MATHFVQLTGVNRAGELVGERWCTIHACEGEERARHYAEYLATDGGCMMVSKEASRRRARGSAIVQGVRIVSLLELLEEGHESAALYWVVVDLSNEDATFFISTHLGFEAA